MTPSAAEYETGAALVELLAARVRTLYAEQRKREQAAQAAIALNGEAHSRLVDGVQTLRALTAALSDSAGLDRPVKLAECIDDARRLLDDEGI